MTTTTATDLAWAAGFIDGEGCITLLLGSHQRQIYLRVSATQIVEAPMLNLQRLFGGTIRLNKNRRRYVLYEWRAFSQRAVDCLVAIRPFMLVKGEQADVALEFWRTCSRPPGWNAKRETQAFTGFSEADREIRLGFLRRMRALNHKGQHLITQSTDRY